METPIFTPLTNEERRKQLQLAVANCKTPEETLSAISKLRRHINSVYNQENKIIAQKCEINDKRLRRSKLHPGILPGILKYEDENYKGKGRKCYVCKDRFNELHHFYHTMCSECAEYNYTKRFQTKDLTGKYAIVTGGRIKIGFEVCLKLLRAGANVVATTRFPKDALNRYSKESDYSEWEYRLQIIHLDLLGKFFNLCFVPF